MGVDKTGDNEQLIDENTSTLWNSMESSAEIIPDINDDGEKIIRKKLEWYFKTPFEKYKDKGRKPFKFLLQIIKIIVITVQATLFAIDEFSIVHFNKNNVETFRSVFIRDYNGLKIKKLFTKDGVYNDMLYAWEQYYSFDHLNTGPYKVMKMNGLLKPIHFCKTWNNKLRNLLLSPAPDDASSSNYNESSSIDKECYSLKPPKESSNRTTLAEFMQQNNLPENIGWILSMRLSYSFQMNYSVVHRENSPDCYKFDVGIDFDNNDLDGIMTVSLNSAVNFHVCRETLKGINITEKDLFKSSQTLFDFIVIFLCLISTSLCIRSFRKHYKIYKDTKLFFLEYRHEEFKFSDRIVFISFWLVMMVLSDLFALAGSFLKIIIDTLEYPELYTSCSLCFGLAVLFSWIGVLRYLGFMKGYNTLLITLKVAFPSIIRFICCVAFIYVGFVICGWIVFGPYHKKFSNLYLTSECLYSLINGDDMFVTFSLMEDVMRVCPLIYYFGKIYLYVFISLFIFVVLSLFIGIVGDTFEKIKDQGSAPKTRLQMFMDGEEYEDVEGSNDFVNSTCTCTRTK